MSQAENHQCLQSIHYLLNIHGFGDIWNNASNLKASSRFTALKAISDNRGHDSYIHTVQAPKYEQFFLG